MASAMEKMVASMLGITPEEMGAMMTGFQDLLKNLGDKLEAIRAQGEENNALLLALTERLENGPGKPTSGGNRSRGGNAALPAPGNGSASGGD